jgi:hypothetical protein
VQTSDGKARRGSAVYVMGMEWNEIPTGEAKARTERGWRKKRETCRRAKPRKFEKTSLARGGEKEEKRRKKRIERRKGGRRSDGDGWW